MQWVMLWAGYSKMEIGGRPAGTLRASAHMHMLIAFWFGSTSGNENTSVSHYYRSVHLAEVLQRMKPRYALKRDANHGEIQEHLEANGVEVVDCSRAGTLPDLLCLYPKSAERGRAGWLETKVLRQAKWTWAQLNFIAHTRFAVAFATNKEDALIFATKGEGCITQSQKDRLALFLNSVKDRKKLWTPKQVIEVLRGTT